MHPHPLTSSYTDNVVSPLGDITGIKEQSSKIMCGKPDTGKLYSSSTMGVWSMAHVVWQQIEYYYY